MNLNLHIEHIDGGGINETILSPESSKPTSPIEKIKKKCIRNSKNKDENENKPITYLFFKNFIHPTLNNDKKGTKFLYKKQLQKSLDLLKIKYKKGDKKEALQKILFDTFNKIAKYDNPKTLSKINTIKNSISKYIKEKRERIYGPGFANKSICKNTEDCFTMEHIDEIPDIYFFSIKDSYNSVFFFDIRTFKKLIDKQSNNPYNREPFLQESIDIYSDRCKHMNNLNISLLYAEEEEYLKNLTPEEKINNKLMDIFGEIDSLNVVAGGTRLEWFNTLNIIQLKKFYRVLEDVWNYRAELSQAKKMEIVPQNNMFTVSVNYIFNLTSKIQIQNLILNEMEKLVKSSPVEEHRHTGAYYVLISLTEISFQCAIDLPWLIQY
jgi:hypothetical protein